MTTTHTRLRGADAVGAHAPAGAAHAADDIEAGGVMVNDVSTFRVDHMPYGGVKLSGFGREGVRYAIEEMTELKLVTVNRRPL